MLLANRGLRWAFSHSRRGHTLIYSKEDVCGVVGLMSIALQREYFVTSLDASMVIDNHGCDGL